MKKCLLLALLAPVLLHAEELTLSQAVDRALSLSHEVLSQQSRLDRLGEERKEAFSRWLPRLNANASYTRLNDPIDLDLSSLRELLIGLQSSSQLNDLDLKMAITRGYGLSGAEKLAYGSQIRETLDRQIPALSLHVLDADLFRSQVEFFQPVWIGGKLEAGMRAARLAFQEGQENLFQSQQRVMADAARLYLLNKLLEEVLEIGRDAERGIARHRDQAESLFRAGLIAKSQVLRARVAHSDARTLLLVSQENLDSARSQLQTLLQLGTGAPPLLASALPFRPLAGDAAAMWAEMERSSPLLRTIALKEQQAHTKRRADLGDYLPQVYLFGRYEILKSDLSLLDPRWAVGATVKLNLFSGGEKLFRLKGDSLLLREVREKKSETRDQLQRACAQLFHAAQAQAHVIDGFADRLEEAEENLRLAESRFSSGLGLSLEVVDANLQLHKIRTEKAQAVYAYDLVRLQVSELNGNVSGLIREWEDIR